MGLIKNIKLALSLKKAVKEITKLKEENEDKFIIVMEQVVIIRNAVHRIAELVPEFKDVFVKARDVILSVGKK